MTKIVNMLKNIPLNIFMFYLIQYEIEMNMEGNLLVHVKTYQWISGCHNMLICKQ